MSDFLDKAKDLAAEHDDKVRDAVDKTAEVADDKTGGKYTEHIDKAADATDSAIDKLSGGR